MNQKRSSEPALTLASESDAFFAEVLGMARDSRYYAAYKALVPDEARYATAVGALTPSLYESVVSEIDCSDWLGLTEVRAVESEILFPMPVPYIVTFASLLAEKGAPPTMEEFYVGHREHNAAFIASHLRLGHTDQGSPTVAQWVVDNVTYLPNEALAVSVAEEGIERRAKRACVGIHRDHYTALQFLLESRIGGCGLEDAADKVFIHPLLDLYAKYDLVIVTECGIYGGGVYLDSPESRAHINRKKRAFAGGERTPSKNIVDLMFSVPVPQNSTRYHGAAGACLPSDQQLMLLRAAVNGAPESLRGAVGAYQWDRTLDAAYCDEPVVPRDRYAHLLA